jgi:hypothetical protein
MPPKPDPRLPGRHSYWAASRAPRYSLLFALPLLILYELLAALLGGPHGSGVRNAADVLVKAPFVAVAGARGPVIFAALVVVVCVWLVWRDVRRSGGPLRGRIFALMLAESAALAVVCGLVVSVVTAQLLGMLGGAVASAGGAAGATGMGPLPAALAAQGGDVAKLGWTTRAMLSLGAGLYEELVFRVLLVSALGAGARAVLGAKPLAAGAFAVVGGALLFSAVHYVGALGDTFTVRSFAFRTVAGLFFSALYVLRGFGITAWTHAIYDMLVLLV